MRHRLGTHVVARAWALLVALAVLLLPLHAAALPLRVLVVAGQSNTVGYGSDATLLPPELQVPQGDVRFWFDVGSFFSLSTPSLRIDSGDQVIPLQFQTDPTGLTFSGPTNGFGPEMRLGRALGDAFPGEIAIVKFAVSGSSLAADWNPATPGSLYHQMLGDVALALGDLTAAGTPGVVQGFFWMQGEADAESASTAASYEANLTSFIQQVRSDFGNSQLPFVFGRINVNIDQSCCFSFPAKDDVRAAQAAVAANVPLTAMVDTDDLPLIFDLLHFTAQGQLGLGQRFADAYLPMAGTCGDGTQQPAELCDDGNTTSGDGCDANCTPTDCGNGIITSGEDCDDANPFNGDCCPDTCQLPSCKLQTEPLKGLLKIRRSATEGGDRFLWKWSKGAMTSLPELGDPTTSDNYTLCLLDSDGVAHRALRAPAGGQCGTKPCWQAKASTGFRYRNRIATPDGLAVVKLHAGSNGQARMIAKGKGELLKTPSLPLALPARLRLVAESGACWEATYSNTGVVQNDATAFQGKAD